MERLDERLEQMHLYLSRATAVPVLGAIPAALKAIAGLVESVVGAVIALISLLVFPLSGRTAERAFNWGVSHVGHGLTRALAALLFVIPCVSCVIGLRTGGIPSSRNESGIGDATRELEEGSWAKYFYA
ncbi:MAG: hypothetical protein S4CHLAM2_14080 [Chlamydiales bacterium]|nr:hypothetical protein [Chlamydiales bacterium]